MKRISIGFAIAAMLCLCGAAYAQSPQDAVAPSPVAERPSAWTAPAATQIDTQKLSVLKRQWERTPATSIANIDDAATAQVKPDAFKRGEWYYSTTTRDDDKRIVEAITPASPAEPPFKIVPLPGLLRIKLESGEEIQLKPTVWVDQS